MQQTSATQQQKVSWVWAVVILLSLALHTLYKISANISPLDMLWACHLASFGIALSILLRAPWLSGVGLLFHTAMGIPAYLLDALATWETSATSVLVHLVPGFVAWKVVSGSSYPKHNLRRTIFFVFLSQVIGLLFTPPALNVNLVFAPWSFIVPYFPNVWLYRLFNYALACALLTPAHFLLRYLLPSPPTQDDALG